MLDAMVALERAHKTAAGVHVETGAEETAGVKPVKNVSSHEGPGFFSNGFAALWDYVRKLFRILVDNDFVVLRHDKQIMAFPVLVLAVLLFAGRQLGQEGVNAAMDKVSDLAGNIKQSIQNAGGDKPDDQ